MNDSPHAFALRVVVEQENSTAAFETTSTSPTGSYRPTDFRQATAPQVGSWFGSFRLREVRRRGSIARLA
jgi:hypothetical protein